MAGKPRIDPEYRTWQQTSVLLNGTAVDLASKPGVASHGTIDEASLLLATHVQTAPGSTVVILNAANGLVTAAIARAPKIRALITDRNVLGIEAVKRTLVANNAPNAEARLGHGTLPLDPGTAANTVIIRIPKERLSLLQLLHDAFEILKFGGTCYAAGATNEGIKTAGRTMEKLFGNVATLAAEGGYRVVRSIKQTNERGTDAELHSPLLDPDTFNQIDTTLRGQPFTIHTRPGVFSWDHADEATSILTEHMVVAPDDRILGLGCGAGALGIVARALAPNGTLTMVDADSEAVRSATRTAAAAGFADARILVSDVAECVLGDQFDLVVTNPPFHVGKGTDLNVPMQFIQDAWTVLAPGGRLNLVANRTLPYEGAIKWRFGNITTVHDGQRFKVLSAVKAEA